MRIAIQGIRTKSYGKREQTKVRVVVEDFWYPSLGEWWVRIAEGGVTGYESCRVDWLLKENTAGGWCACAGTENSWPKLEISAHEMGHVRCALRREYVTRESERI